MPYGLVFDALTALVADDVLLVGKGCGGNLLEQVPHAIRLEPQREFDLVGRDGLEVVGAIEIRRAVQIAGAGAFQQLDVLIRGNVLRALKHHVLEQMRKAGAAGLLVGGADVIPEVDGDERQPVVLRQDHPQPIRQRERFELDVGDVSRGARRRRGGLGQDSRRRKRRRDHGAKKGAKGSHGMLVPWDWPADSPDRTIL